jgi:hypothetical protein
LGHFEIARLEFMWDLVIGFWDFSAAMGYKLGDLSKDD